MKHQFLPCSWEKQSWYLLENGWTACVEYNQHSGPFVKLLLGPGVEEPCGKIGPVWLASNGSPPDLGAAHYNKLMKTDSYVDLPEFARPWVSPGRHALVRPDFLKHDNPNC